MKISLKAYWLVLSRALLHRTQKSHRDDFWAWLYRRVCNPECVDYESKTLVWYLLDDAIRDDEHVRVLTIYRDFQKMIDETASERYRARIVASIDAAESMKA